MKIIHNQLQLPSLKLVRLTANELAFMWLLMNGGTADRQTIVRAVWGDHYIPEADDFRINKLVERIRKKVGRETIQTEHRYGYSLVR